MAQKNCSLVWQNTLSKTSKDKVITHISERATVISDILARSKEIAGRVTHYTCKDADDQKFIDLAVQHGAALHSKDAEVLCMKKRLERCGVVLNPTPL